jgi:GNAT superfamily N-acetyltransferase
VSEPRHLPGQTRVIGAADFAGYVIPALTIFMAAMGHPPTDAPARLALIETHRRVREFVAAIHVDDSDRLLGFAYGYPGARGQWWHDRLAGGLAPELARTWLTDDFDVVELHVDPAVHGQGIGRELLATLLAQATTSTALLTTPDAVESPARALYRSANFTDIATGFRFPGTATTYAVMARQLR